MTNVVSPIIDAALALPPDQRAGLAFRLLQSLKPPNVMVEGDAGLAGELERRSAAYEAGNMQASDWDDVSRRLRKALDDRKSS